MVGAISLAPLMILLVPPVLIIMVSRRGLPSARRAVTQLSPAE